ncbi:MAG: universal stress protein [Rubrobacteraceae bacterium]
MPGVILGYDGSPSAKAALGTAIEQARALGERLIIVFADEPPGRSAGEEFREHRRVLDEIGEKVLGEAEAEARAARIEVEAMILHGKPAVALDAAARERDARLIVIGTYGEGPLRSAILGSTPHKLLHFSEVPVLCVPPPGSKL